MRKFLFLLLLSFGTTVHAQIKDYIISTDGLGPIKLGMTQAELEKLIGKKIPLTNPWDTISGSWVDSAKIVYKNINVELRFQRGYYATDSFRMTVTEIKANSPLCKTKHGIGVGSDKLKILAAYDGYHIDIWPDYNEDGTVKSKTHSTINVRQDTEGNTILFYLVNKKVVGFAIFPVYDDEE